MAALLPSHIGVTLGGPAGPPTRRERRMFTHDDPPSSPPRQPSESDSRSRAHSAGAEDDLPPDFDESFGSSMSISTSYDREAASRVKASLFAVPPQHDDARQHSSQPLRPVQQASGPCRVSSHTSIGGLAKAQSSNSSASRSPRVTSPRGGMSLSAALGTTLHRKEEASAAADSASAQPTALLARLRSPSPMELSSPAQRVEASPMAQVGANGASSFSPAYDQLFAPQQPVLSSSGSSRSRSRADDDLLLRPDRPSLVPRTLRRMASEQHTSARLQSGSKMSAGRTLGRLFSAELSLHDREEPRSPSEAATAASAAMPPPPLPIASSASQGALPFGPLANKDPNKTAGERLFARASTIGPSLGGALKHARNLHRSPKLNAAGQPLPSPMSSPDAQQPPPKRRPQTLPLSTGRALAAAAPALSTATMPAPAATSTKRASLRTAFGDTAPPLRSRRSFQKSASMQVAAPPVPALPAQAAKGSRSSGFGPVHGAASSATRPGSLQHFSVLGTAAQPMDLDARIAETIAERSVGKDMFDLSGTADTDRSISWSASSGRGDAGATVLEAAGLGDFFYNPQSPEQLLASQAPVVKIKPDATASVSQTQQQARRLRTNSESDAEVSFESNQSSGASPTTSRAQEFTLQPSGRSEQAVDNNKTLRAGTRLLKARSRPSLLDCMQGNTSAPDLPTVSSASAQTSGRRPPPIPLFAAKASTFGAEAGRRCLSALDQSFTLKGLRGRNSGDDSARIASARLPRSALATEMQIGEDTVATEDSVIRRSTSLRRNSSLEFVSPSNSMTGMGGYLDEFDANGSPIPAAEAKQRYKPRLLRNNSKDDSSPLGYGQGLRRNNSGRREEKLLPCTSAAAGEFMPGFGASEKEGKVLPCFTVKEDGLVRVKPETVVDLLQGKFSDQIGGYTIVDCRFGYEYEGGKIQGAINLGSVDAVKNHFLTPGVGMHASASLPLRSQSGQPDAAGNLRKHVLVFHCEFSCKRAPSMALALRQADRGIAHDYPNCHYPELYVLQGGYCAFFKEFPRACFPAAYVRMDDPEHQERCSIELNGFRKQFSRHRSFTFGDTNAAAGTSTGGGRTASMATIRLPAMTEADDSPASRRAERTSNGSLAPKLGIKPLSGAASRHLLQARTSLSIASASNSQRATPSASQSQAQVQVTHLSVAPAPGVADASLLSSSDESSFDASGYDSPCAAAAGKRRPGLGDMSVGMQSADTDTDTDASYTSYTGQHRAGSASGAAMGPPPLPVTGARGPPPPRRPMLRAGTTGHLTLSRF